MYLWHCWKIPESTEVEPGELMWKSPKLVELTFVMTLVIYHMSCHLPDLIKIALGVCPLEILNN